MVPMAADDIRFDVPLYTQAEAASHLNMPATTFRSWARGYRNTFPDRPPVYGAPLITYAGQPHSPQPSIPFVGLAEGVFLSALRRADVPMQKIRPALDLVRDKLGIRFALASQRLYAHGAEVLFEVSEGAALEREGRQEARKLIVLKNGQYVFREVVQQHMKLISYDARGRERYANRVELPGYEVAHLAAKPEVNFGRPFFTATGTPLHVVSSRLRSGEPVEEVADDFALPADEVAEVSERVERALPRRYATLCPPS